MDDKLDKISLWIEANRDVSPQKWEEEIWPHIKTLMNEYAIEARIDEITELDLHYWGDDDGDALVNLIIESYVNQRLDDLERQRNKIETVPKIVRQDKFYNGNGHVGTKNYYDDGSVKIETEK